MFSCTHHSDPHKRDLYVNAHVHIYTESARERQRARQRWEEAWGRDTLNSFRVQFEKPAAISRFFSSCSSGVRYATSLAAYARDQIDHSGVFRR